MHLKAIYDTIYRFGQRFHSVLLLMLSFMAFNVFFCILIFTVACNAPVTLPSHTAAFASFLHLENVFTQLCAFLQFPCNDLARSRPQCD